MWIKLLDEIDTNTGIGWWDRNRGKVNEVISAFNNYQVDPLKDSHKRNVIFAMIERCQKYGEENDFSKWQFDLLQEMREHLVAEVEEEKQ